MTVPVRMVQSFPKRECKKYEYQHAIYNIDAADDVARECVERMNVGKTVSRLVAARTEVESSLFGTCHVAA